MEVATAFALMLAIQGCDTAFRDSPLSDMEAELSKFPPHEVLLSWSILGKAYLERIDAAMELEPSFADSLMPLRKEQDLILDTYRWVMWARNNEWMPIEHREDLRQRLRKALGDERYYTGKLPEPIP